MVSICLNDKVYDIEIPLSLSEFLQQHNYTGQHFAVALNNRLVLRGTYETIFLQANDCVDILLPMQGG